MFIDTRNSEVTIWLVKFPPFLVKKIQNQTPGTFLGTITIQPGDQATAKVAYAPSQELLRLGIPSQYKANISNSTNNMYIIKHDNMTAKMEGFIDKECHVCPIINNEYISYKKCTTYKYEKKELNVIDTKKTNFTDKTCSVKELDILARKRKKHLQDSKRERLDKNEVMDIIFRAFERNDSWTAKELGDFSGQPLAYINELLPEICNMNKKDQRNTYQLKDEYKFQKK